MKNIFVSYRRADSSDVTGRIFDQLKQRFGEEHLFKDVESIGFGQDFRRVIADAVQGCDVLLAIIGRDWLTAVDETGRRRLDDPDDFVRLEISSALERDVPVVPVLVQQTAMPTADDLPPLLVPLAYRNAARVRADPDFRHDMDALCTQLAEYIGVPAAPPAAGPPPPAAPPTVVRQDHSNRGVSIGGNATGNVIQTGDGNVASLNFTQTTLPSADAVDIHQELTALGKLLAQLPADNANKIERALADALDELDKPRPDRNEVGEAVERALRWAKKSPQFAEATSQLAAHVKNIVAWLGDNWSQLLASVGLTR